MREKENNYSTNFLFILRIMEMNYVAPELEVLEVMVEQGFAGSDFDLGDTNFDQGTGD